jgi:hypothetical protein
MNNHTEVSKNLNINEIYDKVINNKVSLNNQNISKIINIDILPFEQGNELFIKPEIKEESNYIFDLLNTFKKNDSKENKLQITKKINNSNSENKINNNFVNIKNTLLNHLSNYLSQDISSIKNNIEKHINDEDFEPLKNFSHSYKKSIQHIKKFLIDDNSDNEVTNDLLYYISYLYNISFLIINNNIYNFISYKNNDLALPVLVFQRQLKINKTNLSQENKYIYNILETIEYVNLDDYLKSKKLNKYKTNTELNKLKITELKELCNLMNINNNRIKNLLLVDLNLEFNKF